MLNGAVVYPRNSLDQRPPEVEAILPFFGGRRVNFGQSKEATGSFRPPSHLLLRNLEVLSIETPSTVAASFNTDLILSCLLMNSPKLRRLEVKQSPNFRAISRNVQQTVGTLNNMKELLFFSGRLDQGDMAAMVSAFPRLVSLRAEFRHLSNNPSFLALPSGTSEALLNVSGTLETLSLATYPAEGDWFRSKSSPSSLPSSLSTLNQMVKLKDLTVESIWLFGTQYPDVALQLSHLLPASLVRLHLVDRWGDSEPAHFYPGFPEDWSPLVFYEGLVQALCKECHTYFSGLREVTFASSYLYFHAQATTPCSTRGQDEPGTIQAHIQKFKHSLENFGVKFSIVDPEASPTIVHGDWANIG